MKSTVFPIPAATVIPTSRPGEVFPVRRIYCVGRNYAAHALEMGFDPNREPPFFFCKPADAVVFVASGATAAISYPRATQNFQHEIELVAAIGVGGQNIPVEDAERHIWGYTVGLDMTRRDLQLAARDKGRPWELGKAFDCSAPVAAIHSVTEIGHPKRGAIWLQVDGQERQRSDLSLLIWSVAEVVANLSLYFELQPGDLIFTGTPEGVGPVETGQTMLGGIDNLGTLSVRVN